MALMNSRLVPPGYKLKKQAEAIIEIHYQVFKNIPDPCTSISLCRQNEETNHGTI